MIVLGNLLLLTYAAGYVRNENLMWDRFKSAHNKTYPTAQEEDLRKSIFFDTLHTITSHNVKYKLKMTSFRIGLNQVADKTFKEFLEMNPLNETMKQIMEAELEKLEFNPYENFNFSFPAGEADELPKSFDWREFGAVSRVKDQQECSACYAMAAIGALESQIFIRTRKLLDLSEQEVVDCARNYSNFQCHTGVSFRVFDFIKDRGALSSTVDYPYEGRPGECRAEARRMKIELKGFGSVDDYSSSSDETIMHALMMKGPLVVGLGVAHETFMRYVSGIYSEPACPPRPNHAGLLVGFGSENGEDFWIIKNSWGETWGELGFMRLSRNLTCQFSSTAIYPILM